MDVDTRVSRVRIDIAWALLAMWFRSGSAALLFKFGLDLILHEAVPDRPVLKYWIHRWKVIHLLRVIYSSVLFEVLKWVCLVQDSCFGCALYLCCLSFPVSSTFDTKKFYRNPSQKTISNVCFAFLRSRYFRTELRTEECFCENVFRCRFLFVLNPWEQICCFVNKNEVVAFQRPWFRWCVSPYERMWQEVTVKLYSKNYKTNCNSSLQKETGESL